MTTWNSHLHICLNFSVYYSGWLFCSHNIVNTPRPHPNPVCVWIDRALTCSVLPVGFHETAAPHYGVMEGFISWFPEDKHWETASSYLCTPSKTLEKPTQLCFVVVVAVVYLFVVLWQDVSKALEGAVTNTSKSYHLETLLCFLLFKVSLWGWMQWQMH